MGIIITTNTTTGVDLKLETLWKPTQARREHVTTTAPAQTSLVFVSSSVREKFCSFMFPFYLMKNVSVQQPVFSPNFIQGVIRAEAGGGWEGQAGFRLSFSSGGAIDLSQQLFKLATDASRAPPNGGFRLATEVNGYCSPATPQLHLYPSTPYHPNNAGVFPSAPLYTSPPPPYPGPPQDWSVPPVSSGSGKAAEAASHAFYNPSNPHSVYLPTDLPPPPYYPPEKKMN